MDLRSENPYWLLRKGIPHTYPSLKQNLKKEVVIIGAGISGSLVAYQLQQAGMEVALIDRRHVGMGSTVASTALLQYEIDTPMHRLAGMVGLSHAVKAYELCRQSIYDIEKIFREVASQSQFTLRPSFQYASFKKDTGPLFEEYELRRQHGFDVEWLEASTIEKMFGIKAEGGILSADGAEADAYALTNDILYYLHQRGVAVYDQTTVTDIKHGRNGITLKTAAGHTIQCKKLVIASGYESQHYIPFPVCKLHSTYSIVSEVNGGSSWFEDAMIWETARPYIYVRTTFDRRILVGGADDPWYNPTKRDAALPKKAKLLKQKFNKLMPHIPFDTDFMWAGTFAETKDGLPFIGSIKQRPDTFFALGFGGNGITFSMVAAEILRDKLRGIKNEHEAIFQFGR
jgi:glycine/D-amino acid oxidase-like deaminating enzyme